MSNYNQDLLLEQQNTITKLTVENAALKQQVEGGIVNTIIMGVAVKQGDIVIALPKPNRHHDCMRYAVEVLGLEPPIGVAADDQGFYLANGQYLNRKEAWKVAVEAGVKMRPSPTDGYVNKSGILFSEDLW